MRYHTVMRQVISNYLLKLGFIPNKCGYRYLNDIILQALSGKEILPLRYVAYGDLAKKYGKTVDSIEKDIQNAISAAWLKGDVETLYGEFGETIDMKKGKPGNKQFILTAVSSISSLE